MKSEIEREHNSHTINIKQLEETTKLEKDRYLEIKDTCRYYNLTERNLKDEVKSSQNALVEITAEKKALEIQVDDLKSRLFESSHNAQFAMHNSGNNIIMIDVSSDVEIWKKRCGEHEKTIREMKDESKKMKSERDRLFDKYESAVEDNKLLKDQVLNLKELLMDMQKKYQTTSRLEGNVVDSSGGQKHGQRSPVGSAVKNIYEKDTYSASEQRVTRNRTVGAGSNYYSREIHINEVNNNSNNNTNTSMTIEDRINKISNQYADGMLEKVANKHMDSNQGSFEKLRSSLVDNNILNHNSSNGQMKVDRPIRPTEKHLYASGNKDGSTDKNRISPFERADTEKKGQSRPNDTALEMNMNNSQKVAGNIQQAKTSNILTWDNPYNEVVDRTDKDLKKLEENSKITQKEPGRSESANNIIKKSNTASSIVVSSHHRTGRERLREQE